MKQLTNYILVIVLVAIGFSSCTPDNDIYDETLLLGKWEREYFDKDLNQQVKEYYRYDSNKKGVTWVPSEDITEEEAQAFTWSLVKSELTHIHIMESGSAGVPKVYTVTELSASTLRYKDGFKNTFTYIKVR